MKQLKLSTPSERYTGTMHKLARRTHGVKNVRAEVGEFRRFLVRDARYRDRSGNRSGVGGHHAVDVLPNLVFRRNLKHSQTGNDVNQKRPTM